MNISHLLGIVGPILCAVGAILLAYDIARGRLRLQTRKLFEAQARGVIEECNRLIDRYKSMPAATHAEATARWVDETKAFEKSQLESTRSNFAQFEEEEISHSLRHGVRGLILVAIGSLMQSLSVWLTT